MNKRNSRVGLLGSIALHTTVLGGLWAVVNYVAPTEQPIEEEVTSISMEMMATAGEQPQVAVSAESAPPEKKAEPEPETPDNVVEPKPVVKEKIAEKPKEKPRPKEKPKEKPKPVDKPIEKPKPVEKPKTVKPKVEPEKSVKALETGIVAKEGIVAKAVPTLPKGDTAKAGVAKGATESGAKNNGSSANAGASSNELNAYKVALQRALQRRANSAYPAREKMMRKMGTVTLGFSVSSSGQVINVRVLNSSGNDNLDAAAMKAAQGTKTDPPPAGFPPNVTVPVKFSVE